MSPGPVNMHLWVLKETADVIAKPLHLMFKSRLDTGVLLNTRKLANDSPIFDKEKKNARDNYRLIRITSIACRTTERLIKNGIVNHLEEDSLYCTWSSRILLQKILLVVTTWISVKRLRSVRRRATKLVQAIKVKSFGDRLRALDLPSLEYRRKRGDIISTLKISRSFVDTDPSLLFQLRQDITSGCRPKTF